LWGHNAAFQNNAFLSGGLQGGTILNQDIGVFNAGLQKNMAYGATVSLNQNWNYLWTDQHSQLFPSVYTGNAILNYSQPLWAGAGAEFTRIAGPYNTTGAAAGFGTTGATFQGGSSTPSASGLAAVTGVSQGVVIARINTDISVADFEIQVRNML